MITLYYAIENDFVESYEQGSFKVSRKFLESWVNNSLGEFASVQDFLENYTTDDSLQIKEELELC